MRVLTTWPIVFPSENLLETSVSIGGSTTSLWTLTVLKPFYVLRCDHSANVLTPMP